MVYSIGWKSPHETHTDAVFLDGEISGNIEPEDGQIDPVLLERMKYSKTNFLTEGYRIKDLGMPHKLLWKSKNREPLDSLFGNFTTISERLKNLIEQFEPNVHQFFPIDVYRPKTDEPFARFYICNICNRLNTVDAEHTEWEFIGDYEKGFGRWDGGLDPNNKKKRVFNLEQIGDHKLWRDRHLLRDWAWCTDDLGQAILDSDFTGVSLMHYDQVGNKREAAA